MHGTTSVIQEGVGNFVAGGTDSSVSETFVISEFLRLSQEAGVSVCLRGKGYERLPRTLRENNKRNSPPVSALKGAERLLEVTTESDDVLIRLNDYKIYKEILRRNYSNKIIF